MTVDYNVWESDSGSWRMIEIDGEYFMRNVSTEVKDRAKDKGLIFLDRENQNVVLTDRPDEYEDLLEAFGVEKYLKMRIGGSI